MKSSPRVNRLRITSKIATIAAAALPSSAKPPIASYLKIERFKHV
jgi:hypothetical protein